MVLTCLLYHITALTMRIPLLYQLLLWKLVLYIQIISLATEDLLSRATVFLFGFTHMSYVVHTAFQTHCT